MSAIPAVAYSEETKCLTHKKLFKTEVYLLLY